ncbi:MAG: response regulator [Phycisphaerae bacterium]|nr:response regulator [Phycisphaerae bacterium]NUQ46423.1 response regulator [Phycisphaerae bacterium]
MSKVLVVDDESGYLTHLRRVLIDDGHEVETADSAATAIAVGSRFAPDVLVVDWMLRDRLDGLQVAQMLRQKLPDLAAVVITGYPSPRLSLEAARCDAVAFLEKPFGAADLRHAVRRAATRRVGATVYVIDSHEETRRRHSDALTVAGVRAEAVADADALARTFDPRGPACLVVDLRPPDRRAVEWCRQARDRGVRVPAIILADAADASLAATVVRQGVDIVVLKPVDSARLVEHVRHVIALNDAEGVLTRMTRRLSDRDARELYQAMLPKLALAVLARLERANNMAVVRAVVEHFTRSETLHRLRACAHVRDGILDELGRVLKDYSAIRTLDRRLMTDLINDSGVMNALLAVEACLQRLNAA